MRIGPAGSNEGAGHSSRATLANEAPAGRGRLPLALVLVALSAVLLLSMIFAVSVGPVRIPVGEVWRIVANRFVPEYVAATWSDSRALIVWDIRLPRVLLAAVVGAGLSVVGVALQALVRNPLADPYTFGLTSGASVGAVTVILTGVSVFGIYSLSVAAFLGALAAFALVLLLARSAGGLFALRLLLAGVAVSYVMSALTSVLIFSAGEGDEGAARSVLFWLLGGLGGARWSYLVLPALLIAVSTALLVLRGGTLNALLVGDETARTLGVDVERFRRHTFTMAALLTGSLVAVSGGIGFVGLVMPHIVRLLVGADHRRVLPVAVVGGAIFLVLADLVARSVVAPAELPVGVVTALCGAPVFAFLLKRPGGATPR